MLIRCSADVAALQRQAGPPSQTFILRPPFALDDDLISLAAEIRHHLSDCGCRMGARFLIAAIIANLALTVFRIPMSISEALLRILVLLASAVLAALLGKAFGIFRARRRYFRCLGRIFCTLREQELRLNQTPKEEANAWSVDRDYYGRMQRVAGRGLL
jgi:hypothetical protein